MGQVTPLAIQAIEALRALPKSSEWVFPGMAGKPWAKASVTKQWGIFRHRLNLDNVTLHDLRRTCVSYLAMAGENLPTIQHVLNHRSFAPRPSMRASILRRLIGRCNGKRIASRN